MTRPQVFGYLRSTDVEPAKLVILEGELALHAGNHGLELLDVYVDMPCTGLLLQQRGGFNRLMTALWRKDGAGVLIPARSHLSWLKPTRKQLERRITDTGAKFHFLWDNDEHPELRP